MEKLTVAYTLYKTQFRMIFGGKFRYQKEYDHALDVLGERGHWNYLYASLEGPRSEEVRDALEKWILAFQAKADNQEDLKRDLYVLIYGNYKGKGY
jgi:hypothetical protein